MLVPTLTLPVRGDTAFVATMPVPASPSGGHSGMPGWSVPVGSSRAAPSSVSRPASCPARSTSGSRSSSCRPSRRSATSSSNAASSCVRVAAGRGVDREHARRVADAQHPAPGQAPVDVAGERGEEADLRHVRLVVEDRLVVVGDRPPQRDVVAEELGELGRGALGRGVAPRTEGDEELAVVVEREVAVHHRGHADGPDGRRAHAVPAARRRRAARRRSPAGRSTRSRASRSTRGRRTRSPSRGCRSRATVPSVPIEAGLDAGGSELDAERRAAGTDRCCGVGRVRGVDGHVTPVPMTTGRRRPDCRSTRPARACG